MLKQYPFYFKCTIILLGLILFVYVIFNLREILVPLSFSLLIAILLNPMVNRFQQWKNYNQHPFRKKTDCGRIHK